MQPNGAVPPPMARTMAQQQYPQYQQASPPPPQQWSMMPPQQPAFQPQPPAAWPQQPPLAPAAIPPPQPQQFAAAPSPTALGGGASSDEIRSLWIGDLRFWMDETYLSSCFYHTGELSNVKVIRNKQTGQSEGYGFLEFRTRAAAESVLQTYNGLLMPNSEQNFRLNWATQGAGEKRDNTPDYTIFVGDLAADVTDYVLQETFKAFYSSVKGAKVVIDRNTGRSKGYGFVRFADESEQLRAMAEMNGVLCSTRPMRVGPAASKKPLESQQNGNREALTFGGPATCFS